MYNTDDWWNLEKFQINNGFWKLYSAMISRIEQNIRFFIWHICYKIVELISVFEKPDNIFYPKLGILWKKLYLFQWESTFCSIVVSNRMKLVQIQKFVWMESIHNFHLHTANNYLNHRTIPVRRWKLTVLLCANCVLISKCSPRCPYFHAFVDAELHL